MLKRRDFLRSAAVVVGAGLLPHAGLAASRNTAEDKEIIDFETFLPREFDGKPFGPEGLTALADEAGVGRFIVFPETTARPDNAGLAKRIKGYPRLIGCASVNPALGGKRPRGRSKCREGLGLRGSGCRRRSSISARRGDRSSRAGQSPGTARPGDDRRRLGELPAVADRGHRPEIPRGPVHHGHGFPGPRASARDRVRKRDEGGGQEMPQPPPRPDGAHDLPAGLPDVDHLDRRTGAGGLRLIRSVRHTAIRGQGAQWAGSTQAEAKIFRGNSRRSTGRPVGGG